ncbi:unnamed protein product, partial [Polarella glacialis]
DEWEVLEKLSVRELRKQAAIKCVPLTHISSAIEKSDLIRLIIKAGPVLDQYDVNVGVKVYSAQTLADLAERPKGPKVKKDKDKKKKKKDKEKDKDKKKKGASSSSESSSNKKKRKRSKSRKGKKRKDASRSPSLTMMLPADAPALINNPEAAMAALLPAVRQFIAPAPLK